MQRHPTDLAAEATLDTFERFYRAERPEVARAVVLAVGGRELGLEATDEAFARALARWGEVSSFENPAGWTYRVAVNWARSRMRIGAREVPGLVVELGRDPSIPELELLAAVAQLPLRYRVILAARFYLDWTVDQTAETLGMPPGTVTTRQHRALKRLRTILGEQR